MSRRVFISHAGADALVARSTAAYLRRAGLEAVSDREQLRAGESFLFFMDEALSTSDYCLLLWSLEASRAKWVRIEWEAALHRAVSEARAFLVVGRLDIEPIPSLLAPRLFVELHPELQPGIDGLVRLWLDDNVAETQSGKPVASNHLLESGSSGTPVYITSELFDITIPVSVDLSIPAGVLMLNVKERLSLPSSLDYRGQMGVRFEYALFRGDTLLEPSKSLMEQGVKERCVLWLQCTMQPFAARPPESGQIERVSFRRENSEAGILSFAQRRLASVLRKAGVGKLSP